MIIALCIGSIVFAIAVAAIIMIGMGIAAQAVLDEVKSANTMRDYGGDL